MHVYSFELHARAALHLSLQCFQFVSYTLLLEFGFYIPMIAWFFALRISTACSILSSLSASFIISSTTTPVYHNSLERRRWCMMCFTGGLLWFAVCNALEFYVFKLDAGQLVRPCGPRS